MDYKELTDAREGEPSAAVRERVLAARDIQRRRFAGTGLHANAQMGPRQISRWCRLDDASSTALGRIVQEARHQRARRASHPARRPDHRRSAAATTPIERERPAMRDRFSRARSGAAMTERIETHALGECFAAHRALWEAAATQSRRLSTARRRRLDLCVSAPAACGIAAEQRAAVARRCARRVRSWRECILADRQIRCATYRALRDGTIDNARLRRHVRAGASRRRACASDERQRLRRELRRLVIV